ncbi:hypothetical protein BMR07_17540 [Methylococcaceae bacterium CS1]|nr:hypothetical protein BMR10_16510 [Methylococcaceae bacterium CS4]TXK93380.1 hypothetical protein BMR11_17040 [Methylococcaceae bacterium CS5]TXL02554.1 hypothetical protein BMR07_17540 [Methylococcaceae bacterium CS1]TXL03262.1 hypothetical protein BMR08_17315 [Methylococcaceae bacterium CS2]TXL04159.1 hypothetical protein BMR09_13285 [Methylococcaceae bacterium CS3]
MNKKLLLILLLMSSDQLMADKAFEDFKHQQHQDISAYNNATQQEFLQYKKQLDAGFIDLQKAYQQASNQYQEQMTSRWGSFKESDHETWVNYAEDGQTRQSVNFATGVVEVDILANRNETLAAIKQQAMQSVTRLLATTEKQAFENDVVAQKVEARLKQHAAVVKTSKLSTQHKVMSALVSDISQASKSEIKELSSQFINTTKVTEKKLNDKQKIVKLTFKIPEKLSNKAARYSARVKQIASKENIPISLVFAVIETESNFNPLAKSHVPAYGLMQIVPMSAGKDASKYLFGQEKVLSPSYLYNGDNNIAIGGAYLHILYHQYLNKIDDKLKFPNY